MGCTVFPGPRSWMCCECGQYQPMDDAPCLNCAHPCCHQRSDEAEKQRRLS